MPDPRLLAMVLRRIWKPAPGATRSTAGVACAGIGNRSARFAPRTPFVRPTQACLATLPSKSGASRPAGHLV